ncbi:MAG: hypothetical protein COB46_03365 [Rhodospirillaceae bacterium]|nr:MAG: hypothetical protein COB46_03365 [Rhodospirillaceae bacterium]
MADLKLSDLRILFVDDDPQVLKLVTLILKQIGVKHVMTKDNAKDALAYLNENASKIEILLVDLLMPDMDGIELISALKTHDYKGGIAILSGANQNLVQLSGGLAAPSGINWLGTYTKPATKEKLQTLLHKFMDAG